MRKTLLFGIACLLAACGGNSFSPIQFEKFDEQVSVTSPEGGIAGMTLSVDIPVGEGEVQNRVAEGIRTIIKESQVEEELKQPVEGPLKDVCKNLVDYFQKAITTGEYDPAGALAFDLMVECEYQNDQAVFLHVTDGVFGNGAPSECYKIIRLSDGHLMEDAEVASVPVDDLMKLIQKYGDKDQKDIDEGWLMDYTYLCPIADSCKVLYLYGSHFWNTITVPMGDITGFLTEEGKVLLGVKDGLTSKPENAKKDEEQEVQEDKHMEFLGLQLGGEPKPFIEALRQRGFTKGSGSSEDNDLVFLKGRVNGVMQEISINTEGNRVNTVSFGNMVESEEAAINLCNRFKEEMTALYGGKWEKLYDGAEEMKLPYGSVGYTYGMFDSGDYEVGMTIKDTGTSR
ncbi:MAG: hypothetical protein IJ190_13665 [Prevotella sp.]|nr:hypothetical protein [Prevotella sp.]